MPEIQRTRSVFMPVMEPPQAARFGWQASGDLTLGEEDPGATGLGATLID